MSKELLDVKDKVACPKKAMDIVKDEAFCCAEFSMFRKTVKKVSLGSIPEDIISNCTDCKSKMVEMGKTKSVILTLNEWNEVKCPAYQGKEVSVLTSCRGCPFFNNEHFKKALAQNDDVPIENISCNYPRPSFEAMKAFLNPEVKKSLKRGRTLEKKKELEPREAII